MDHSRRKVTKTWDKWGRVGESRGDREIEAGRSLCHRCTKTSSSIGSSPNFFVLITTAKLFGDFDFYVVVQPL